MNFDYLKYFIDAVDNGSITKAAQVNNISQQGLSRAIRCLEREFGVELIDHSAKSFILTDVGNAFLKQARILNGDYKSLSDVMARHMLRGQGVSTNARFFTTPNINRTIAQPLLDFLLERKPDLLPAVVETSFKEVVHSLMYASTENLVALIALADRFKADLEKTPLVYEPIMKVELRARVAQDSELARRSIVTNDDLFYGTLALQDDPYLLRYLEGNLGWPYDIAGNFLTQTNDSAILDRTIMMHHSIGFTNSFEAKYQPQTEFVLLPLEDPCEITVYYVYSPLAADNPFIKEMSVELHLFAERYPM